MTCLTCPWQEYRQDCSPVQEAGGSREGSWGVKTWKISPGLDLPSSGTAAPDVVTKHQAGLSLQETGVGRVCAREELF